MDYQLEAVIFFFFIACWDIIVKAICTCRAAFHTLYKLNFLLYILVSDTASQMLTF